MRLPVILRETPIGRALLVYFFDLPRWTLLNAVFALALAPVLVAGLRGEIALALLLSFPAALVLAGLLRLLSATLEGDVPRWRLLWTDVGGYCVVLSVWTGTMLAGLALLTPLLYIAVIPVLILLLLAPLTICGAARLNTGVYQAWHNAFVMAVHYPIVALGLILLGVMAAWGVAVSGGALIIALPGLWAAIAVYTVDDLIRSLQEQGNPHDN